MLSWPVMSNSLRRHGRWPTRLLCPWNFPGRNSLAGCHFLLKGIFPTQGSNLCLMHLLHWQADCLPVHRLTGTQISILYQQVLPLATYYTKCVEMNGAEHGLLSTVLCIRWIVFCSIPCVFIRAPWFWIIETYVRLAQYRATRVVRLAAFRMVCTGTESCQEPGDIPSLALALKSVHLFDSVPL